MKIKGKKMRVKSFWRIIHQRFRAPGGAEKILIFSPVGREKDAPVGIT